MLGVIYFQNTNAEQLFLGDQIIGKSQLHIVQSVLDRLKTLFFYHFWPAYLEYAE